MENSEAINDKLSILLCNLIYNCIHKARIIPYIMKQEEVINILVEDPALFESLVQKEQSNHIGDSKKNLAVGFDAIYELQEEGPLNWTRNTLILKTDKEIASFVDLINRQTTTFDIYINNAFTLLDKQLDDFVDRFHQFLQQNGMELKPVELSIETFKTFEEKAHSYLKSGEFVQAFLFERLLMEQSKIKKLIKIPELRISLRQRLVRYGITNSTLATDTLRFIIRASYLSKGNWDDLLQYLIQITQQEPGLLELSTLLEHIENDVVFCCNSLKISLSDLKKTPTRKMRTDIMHFLGDPTES